jgi:regulator of sigma E protease
MLSILLFAVFFLWQGIAIDEPVVGKVNAMPGFETGLMPGDRILAVGGRDTPDLETFGTVAEALEPVTPVSYRVQRGADVLTIDGPFPLPPVVESVRPTSAAMQAGLLAGDVILSVDGQPVTAFRQLGDAVGNSGGAPLALTVWRDGDVFEVSLQARQLDLPLPEGGFETRWLIGLIGGLAFVPETRTPGLFEAISLGAQQTWGAITLTVSGQGHMITGAISTCNLSGPITIAETSGAAATLGLASFLWFIALLSTAVGFANLIPIPVLDGGHLVLHAFEAVTGRPPSDRALRVLMAGGFALILSLMVFALSNDVFCP